MSTSRILLYSTATLCAAALCYLGFVHEPKPDYLTDLSAARMQLGIAHAMPAVDKDGNELDARRKLVATAREQVARAASQHPDLLATREMQAFLAMVDGMHLDAARLYGEALELEGVDEEVHDSLVFNQVRCLDQGGESARGLAVLDEALADIQDKYQTEALLLRARLLARSGDRTHAVELLRDLGTRDGVVAMARVDAGEQLEGLGLLVDAEAAYALAAESEPLAHYFLSRLKVRAGDVDESLVLLEREAAAAPAEVRKRLTKDASAWRLVEADGRFQAVQGTVASPGR